MPIGDINSLSKKTKLYFHFLKLNPLYLNLVKYTISNTTYGISIFFTDFIIFTSFPCKYPESNRKPDIWKQYTSSVRYSYFSANIVKWKSTINEISTPLIKSNSSILFQFFHLYYFIVLYFNVLAGFPPTTQKSSTLL